LGGTNTKIGLVDRGGKIITKRVLSTKDYKKKEDLIEAIVNKIKEILTKGEVKKSELSGIGMGLPGLVDSRRGVIHYLPNVPGWENFALKSLMEKRMLIPTFIDNDVNVMTLAELKFGAAKGTKNAICLTLGTGVGGGIILEGRIFRGSSFAAGEVGHIPINVGGIKCPCGGWGCMERYVGNEYIVKRTKKEIRRGRDSLINRLTHSDLRKITPQIISQAAKLKDKLAREIWQEVGRNLGVALVGVVNFFNPEKIIIGGGVSEAGRILFDEVRKTIKKRAMRVQAKSVKILKSKLGKDAGLIGAAMLVF
jgi:glucokinase